MHKLVAHVVRPEDPDQEQLPCLSWPAGSCMAPEPASTTHLCKVAKLLQPPEQEEVCGLHVLISMCLLWLEAHVVRPEDPDQEQLPCLSWPACSCMAPVPACKASEPASHKKPLQSGQVASATLRSRRSVAVAGQASSPSGQSCRF